MTATIDDEIAAFRARFSGQLFMPNDEEYDSARSVWNGAIDHKPVLIARCATNSDVAAALEFARRRELEISVRGGAHNFAGAAVADSGLVIDLKAMNAIAVDPSARTARCGGGTTWAQLDAATQQHGLATPGGTVSHTGVGGLTLGGGFGWLTGKAGLSCDNVLSAEIVTADGRILQLSAEDNPELFWAIRGGGGNFGVVTSFEFRLHEVGPIIQFSLFFWPLDQGADALRIGQEAFDNLPADMGILLAGVNAPPAPFVPEEHHFRPGYGLMLASFGSPEEHARLIDPIRAALPPLFEAVMPLPYLALQQLLDEGARWGILAYEKAHYLDRLTADAIDVVSDRVPRKNSPMSLVPMFPMRGAYCAVGDSDTAFGGPRSRGFAMNVLGITDDPAVLVAERAWVREFWDALRPHAGAGSYVNFMSESDNDRVKATYGAQKYARLARIKATYDPENVFHRNANIHPAT